MIKKSFLYLIFHFIVLYSFAQNRELQYGGLQQFSLTSSDVNTLPGINIINGIRYNNRYYAGIGFTFNFIARYNQFFPISAPYRSVPLYADFRYYLGKKRSLFTFTDIGINPTLINKHTTGEALDHKGYRGFYWNLGAGVKARLAKEVFYTLDLCYNISNASIDWKSRNQFGQITNTHYEIKSNLFIIRMGIEI